MEDLRTTNRWEISNSRKDSIYLTPGFDLFQVFLRMLQVQLRTTQTCRDVNTGILSTVCVFNYHPWESWISAAKGKSQVRPRYPESPKATVSLHSHIYCLLTMGLFQSDFRSCCCSKEYFQRVQKSNEPQDSQACTNQGRIAVLV